MPSFDIVSEIDQQELVNAVDQTQREVDNRFDFKGSDARIERADATLTLEAQNEFQVKQMLPILEQKLTRRGIDIGCLDPGRVEETNNRARQALTLRQGIDSELAKKIVKLIKASKLKVQASIQGEQVRVTGKKRDDLQAAIAEVKGADLGLPLQFTNFRD